MTNTIYNFPKERRNNWERLHKEYPEAKQMKNNNKGFDWLMTNSKGTHVKIEEKYRRKDGKFETRGRPNIYQKNDNNGPDSHVCGCFW